MISTNTESISCTSYTQSHCFLDVPYVIVRDMSQSVITLRIDCKLLKEQKRIREINENI